MDLYGSRLAAVKECYPFLKWAEWGIDQHTEQALNLFGAVFNHLIERLTGLGEHAPESDKIAAIRHAIEVLNALNKEEKILIETDEREDLCNLCNSIATAAAIDPTKYGEGEGPASEWRDW
jgi:hypothetical protein